MALGDSHWRFPFLEVPDNHTSWLCSVIYWWIDWMHWQYGVLQTPISLPQSGKDSGDTCATRIKLNFTWNHILKELLSPLYSASLLLKSIPWAYPLNNFQTISILDSEPSESYIRHWCSKRFECIAVTIFTPSWCIFPTSGRVIIQKIKSEQSFL